MHTHDQRFSPNFFSIPKMITYVQHIFSYAYSPYVLHVCHNPYRYSTSVDSSGNSPLSMQTPLSALDETDTLVLLWAFLTVEPFCVLLVCVSHGSFLHSPHKDLCYIQYSTTQRHGPHSHHMEQPTANVKWNYINLH